MINSSPAPNTAALEGRTVLVAGASGLVGSAIVRALTAATPFVTMVGTYHRAPRAVVENPRVRYLQGDLTTRAGCAAAVNGCNLAVLAAAVTGGAAQAKREPWRQVTENVVMDSLLLEALHTAGVHRVVYLSSASIYPDFEGLIREDQLDWNADPAPPHMGVGWAKRYIEKQCAFWHKSTGMEFAIARVANAYGPYAQFDPANSHFVAALIRKAADRMDPFEVWGSLDATRDIIYADDVADAVVRMLVNSQPFSVFNIGSEQPTTVGEIVKLALKHLGHHPKAVRCVGEGTTTIAPRVLDCAKAHKELGWSIQIPLEEGVRRTMEWWLLHKDTWSR